MQPRISLCSVCHSQMPAGQSYCKNCGSTLCPHCREILPQRSRFCPKCGFLCVVEQPNPINKSVPPTVSTRPQAVPVPRPSIAGGQPAARAAAHQQSLGNTVALQRNCPKCGATIDPELGRCSGCGLLYGVRHRAVQQPAAPAMPIPRPTPSRQQSSTGQQPPRDYRVTPQYSNPRHTPPPARSGQLANYMSVGASPQGGMLMPIPRIAPAAAGSMAPQGAPVPTRPYQYHAAPAAPTERRAAALGRRGLSGFATTIIIVMVCLLVGGGIYYFVNRTGTTPTPNSAVSTSTLAMQNLPIASTTETEATIKWTTDKPSTSLVEITDASGAVIKKIPEETLASSHSITIGGLRPSTTYHYTVVSTDAGGNKMTSEGELTTSATADKTPPSISGVAAANITESSAIITWVTDEPATGQIKYTKDGGNTSTTPMDSNLATTHSITLTNLDSGTTYSFSIISKDAAGNEATSSASQTFTTLTPIPVGTQVGNRAPDFVLQDLSGKDVRLGDFRGKSVIINFWATWCGPCKDELPYIQAVSNEWASKGVVVLPIASNGKGETVTLVEQYINENNYNFPQVLFDANGQAESLYGVDSLPTTFFIDAEGIITKPTQVGSFDNQAAIENILNSIK